MSRRVLGRLILQSGAAGSATIADGASLSDSFVFFLRSSGFSHPMSLNGEGVTADDIAVLPPGKPFALMCRGPHKWLSLSVPVEALEEAGFSRSQLHALAAATSLMRVPHGAARQLAAAITDAIDFTHGGPIPANTGRACDIERELLADLFAAISRGDTSADASMRRSNRSLDRIVRQALAFLRTQDGQDPHVEHLCRAIDVAERSLLRAFHKFFGIGPTQYLKLRRLNNVHYALQAAGCKGATVTGVLTNHGVTELGRFAGAYKSLFGESPSETLKRKAEAAHHAVPPADSMQERVRVHDAIEMSATM
jgi:AraC-like DNA-binding protein